ncbi:hypothetical protein JSO19_10870 [Leucobacter sp. UCMA 4100]|uniref:hypothetical protein n=1 Tax=Leucobacter sp. UCMA 4100 TaxID=2810534 RepID=UPI0022EB0FEB|nr:hypothetical protein [Leucobacter sp. UCMA 4100]MDA3147877.1 hypothetical protein [Leucobacter sp. UCMA 4100]
MTESPRKKKVVKASEVQPKSSTSAQGSARPSDGPIWTPTEEAARKAKTSRFIAWGSWAIAIITEIATIIWVLPHASEKLWLLLVMLIPIALFAIAGNLMWKKANRLSPASRENAFAFFVQNQLGAIMTVIAFLPLVIVILLDENMSGKQKAVAGGLAGLALVLIATLTGIERDGGPSQEQYAEEENIMLQLTGKDEVFWVKNGSVFHVCEAVPDVNKESADGRIFTGSVAEAHEAGKDRLTKRWQSEAVKHCGYTQEDVDKVTQTEPQPLEDPPAKDGEDSGDDEVEPDDQGSTDTQ